MFTTPCFIRKNTSELRKKLEELGYVSHIYNNNDTNNIYVDKLGTYISVDIENQPYFIDCNENEELFLALAALRDDKPDYQWFVWDDTEAAGEKFKQYIPGEPWQDWWWFEVHKATVEELIEHFK
jgi:hypothetical protein